MTLRKNVLCLSDPLSMPRCDMRFVGSFTRAGKIPKFVTSLYAESHIDHGKQIAFDDQTFVERGAYKSVTQTSINGVYPSGIPFCRDDDEINQYMNQHLNWQNGDALILMGYYDEEKINRTFEEVQQRRGFCGIEEAELDLYHAVSS